MGDIKASALGGSSPMTSSVTTADLVSAPPITAPPTVGDLYPQGEPEPAGTSKGEEARALSGSNTDPIAGSGVDGELVVWEGRYSARNFLGRWILLGIAAIGWGVLAARTQTIARPGEMMSRPAMLAGVVVVGLTLLLIYRMLMARYSHYYKLTTRRLFVSTGFMHRRRDQMELLRVKDVFTRQLTLFDRILGLGTVVVAPTDKDIPTLLIAGVDEPKRVMDLIWHHARAERDQRSVKVDSV
jgi:membrane protein YdbS with pleckstrin-like domain